jgi:thienamycin biosynthesis protein ThnN
MNPDPLTEKRSASADAAVEHLRRVIALHFDAERGSPFWLKRAAVMGVEPLREIRELRDLSLLGEMSPEDLQGRPLTDLVPRGFHRDLSDFVVGQTGGTTGGGVWTAYREDEFETAFVTPFVEAAGHVGFPQRQPWLFVGPTGPHLIGKAARCLARRTGSPDPFCVDFDARWAKRLPADSFALQRYLAHVVEQATAIIETQPIGVLFTTPMILKSLAPAMSRVQRGAVRGVHYGGMALAAHDLKVFANDYFPEAVHLSGYGNTLFGCCLELSTARERGPAYYPYGDRLLFETVDEDGVATAPGEPGRVRFTRLDESMLIVRMCERDHGALIPPPADAPPGFRHAGILDPHVPPTETGTMAVGLY